MAAKPSKIRYEGYGPGGVAVLGGGAQRQPQPHAAELRLAFSKNGGNLGESGCVGFLFHHRSEVTLIASNAGGIDENAAAGRPAGAGGRWL